MSEKFLITGREILADIPGFKLLGRDTELQDMAAILLRARSNSVLLHGPGGVGCTALCCGLQAAKDQGKDSPVPFDIINKSFLFLDSDALFGQGNQQEISEAFSLIMAELHRTIGSVLIISDTRDFIEGCRNTGNTHMINMLVSAIQKKKTQAILETRDEDLDYVLKSHSDLVEIFTRMQLEEPTGDALVSIVCASAESLSKTHLFSYEPEAIATAIDLTTKHRPTDAGLQRAQPERSVTLLDRAFTLYRMKVHSDHKEQLDSHRDELLKLYRKQREAEQAITTLNEELRDQLALEDEAAKGRLTDQKDKDADNLKLFIKASRKANLESETVKKLRRDIDLQQQVVQENTTKYNTLTAELNKGFKLTADFVEQVFSEISGIDVSKLKEGERVKLAQLDVKMKERIYGQDEGLDKIVAATRIAKLGKRKAEKPVCFLILGPTGVGKTETSKGLAEYIYDDLKALSRYDMGEYMEKHAVARLIGAPPGYEGFDIGGTLTNAGRARPRQVFLIDEVEKAHPDCMNVFLPVTDEGILTDGIGRKSDYKESIFIFTTNIGQEYFLDPDLTWDEAKEKAMIDCRKFFRPEFLARFGGGENVLCYRRLDHATMAKIVKRDIGKINAAYNPFNISVSMSPEAINAFSEKEYNPRQGARGLPELIKYGVEGPIVENLMKDENFTGHLDITFDTATGKLVANILGTANDQRSVA